MSNDPSEVRAFWEELDRDCIYKAFTPPSCKIADTSRLTGDDVQDLDKLQYEPIIIQERIHKKLEVRVNVFRDTIFAASVNTQLSAADLDWRIDLTATRTAQNLPQNVCE